MTAGINGDLADRAEHRAGEGIKLSNALDKIAKKLDAQRPLFLMGRENVHHIATHAKSTTVKVNVVALVLNVYQAPQNVIPRYFHLVVEQHKHAGVVLGRAK